MRKIISILIALGLVLSLSAIATPVAAAVTQPHVVVFDTDCACDPAAGYNITFNITASLTEGVHEICVEFPAGTTVPASFATGDITITGTSLATTSVFGSEVTVVGKKVCFLVPVHVTAANNPITVTFKTAADIGNPCVAGTTYKVKVNTTRDPDSAQVESAAYTIRPQYSSYKFVVDFSPTYPGIALDFIPPFKACGQNMSTTTWDPALGEHGGFWEPFTLNFTKDVSGCNYPCDNVTLWAEVIAIPEGETLSVYFPLESRLTELTSDNVTLEEGVMGDEDLMLWPGLGLAYLDSLGGSFVFPINIHFSSPGTYEFCIYAECPGVSGCNPADEQIIASRCLPAVVHQWKDAAKLTLREKWNLISLPLVPFDTSIESLLASIDPADRADILSIWHYDPTLASPWLVWTPPTNGDTLHDMVDGEAYWVRVDYPLDDCGNITWWVWGTEMPMPESGPAEYPVVEGWNMVGFTSLSDYLASVYLWNWNVAPKPVVYGWTQGCWTAQGWDLISDITAENLISGQGYWMAFPHAGAIYVPTP